MIRPSSPLTMLLSRHTRRIGVLMSLTEDHPDTKARLAGLQQGLEKLGWSEGQNVRIDYRFAPAGTGAQLLAKELVALQPDVILGSASPATRALQLETDTIPIVFTGVADPIGSGFVASLARPGGNITGLLLFEASITGKWLAMLKEIAQSLGRAALAINPKTAPYYKFYLVRLRPRLPHSALRLYAARSTAHQLTSSTRSMRLRACRTAAWSCRRIPIPASTAIS